MDVVTCQNLPEDADAVHIYHLTPVNPDPAYYTERTDRNIGWISREEQDILKRKTVGISGCGGMGGADRLHLDPRGRRHGENRRCGEFRRLQHQPPIRGDAREYRRL